MAGRTRLRSVAVLFVGMACAAVAASILAVATNAATEVTGSWPLGLDALRRHPFRWMVAGVVLAAVASFALWWLQHRTEQPDPLIPPGERLDPWVVDRPRELGAIKKALLAGRSAVGITTALSGAGGFGKTTLARMVRADPQVIRHFKGRILWLTFGRDTVTKSAVAEKVNDLIARVDPRHARAFTDPGQAGEHLAALLNRGDRVLLVLDDVWYPQQLAPFRFRVPGCAQLVTTRNPALLHGSQVIPVKLDAMSDEQAVRLLTWNLDGAAIPAATVTAVLAETGRWPLLLRLINKILLDEARTGGDVSAAVADIRERLRRRGALAVDDLTGAQATTLDIDDPDRRQLAVRATIEASTGLLAVADRERLAELGVFAEDETVPLTLVRRLWKLDPLAARQLCVRLDELALVSLSGDTVTLHDVVRDYLRAALRDRLDAVNAGLLATFTSTLPAAEPLEPGGPSIAWWDLSPRERYLWDHLVEHAGPTEGEAIAADLRWVEARLRHFGVAAPYADLRRVGTQAADELALVLLRAAHLLRPTKPPQALTDVLHARVAEHPRWATQAATLRERLPGPRLVSRWPQPDLPDPAVRRTLSGRSEDVNAIAVSADGRWLASADDDGCATVWDVRTGEPRATYRGTNYEGSGDGVGFAPDGSWLAVALSSGLIRLWDLGTGSVIAEFGDLVGRTMSMAVSRDGAALVIGERNGRVTVWDIARRKLRAELTGHKGEVLAVAVAPDGSWLVTGGMDGTARLWNPAKRTGTVVADDLGPVDSVTVAPDGTWFAAAAVVNVLRWERATGEVTKLKVPDSGFRALAISPDGTRLAVAAYSKLVIVDAATGKVHSTVARFADDVVMTAYAPDGTWLAAVTGRDTRILDLRPPALGESKPDRRHRLDVWSIAAGRDTFVTGGNNVRPRVWDARSGELLRRLPKVNGIVNSIAVPASGSWVAAAWDHEVLIANRRTGKELHRIRTAKRDVEWVSAAPDGSWLAGGDKKGNVVVWDATTGVVRQTFESPKDSLEAVVVSPDGSWIAAGGYEEKLVVWDVAHGSQRHVLRQHSDTIRTLAVAPDGTWLACGDDDGRVLIWEPSSGQRLAKLRRHRGEVVAVAVTDDGRWLATVGDDRDVRLWDCHTWELATMTRLDSTPRGCAWTSDPRVLLVGTEAGICAFDLVR
ncbi:hypothetical protein Ais01nite_57290 [Asanoa ishikariensis]|uniref:WD-40 repeat-containing protein n=1 Tax=Asanoa ishikariensis TaxID=137265 RepID=A0A1H3TZZ7_9ACTN|nr:NB-ARC domain-containing protein [Asanoa ishikariensis]GIF67694.1 hypothetical protein Ais01nite_57290 [Asanoa ishikariensis]SDZ55175.1 WD-40 repeat-containing protein [Asanoa ishikariensis]